MAEPKTQRTAASVSAFLNGIADVQKRRDCKAIDRMMRAATGSKPAMWGTSIVGFSPRAQNITLYVMPGFAAYRGLLQRLGKHTTGKACLYVKRLSDVDTTVLAQLIDASVKAMRAAD